MLAVIGVNLFFIKCLCVCCRLRLVPEESGGDGLDGFTGQACLPMQSVSTSKQSMPKDIKLSGVSRVSLIDHSFVSVGLMKVKKMERLREPCYCLMRLCWKRTYLPHKSKVPPHPPLNKLKVPPRHPDRNQRLQRQHLEKKQRLQHQ